MDRSRAMLAVTHTLLQQQQQQQPTEAQGIEGRLGESTRRQIYSKTETIVTRTIDGIYFLRCQL